MRIHSNVITLQDVYAARRAAGSGVYFQDNSPTEHGSRSHARAFDVKLESDGTPDDDGTSRRRRTNGGTRGAGYDLPHAASWSDWGRFLAHLFDIDPNARATYYANASDFHAKTAGRFYDDAPDDVRRTINGAADAWRATRGLSS